MKVTRIANGIRVRCQECGKYHIVRGMTGNNLEWEDASGWSGSFDVAHGYFASTQAPSYCKEHTAERKKQYHDMLIELDRLAEESRKKIENLTLEERLEKLDLKVRWGT